MSEETSNSGDREPLPVRCNNTTALLDSIEPTPTVHTITEESEYQDQQDTIDNSSADHNRHGNLFRKKDPSTFRICFVNINGIPDTNDHPKNHHIQEMITNLDCDFFGMTEINKNWSNIPLNHR